MKIFADYLDKFMKVFLDDFMVYGTNVRGKSTASSLSADGCPLMAGPNLQSSDGNPIVISILRQLANGPENVPEM